MDTDQKVAIIVPVYNVEKYLTRCVNSISTQTYRRLEIILVDDGSTDSSGDMCNYFASRDTRIKVIHKSNGGLSDARNAGLKVAESDYLTFIDSDDYVSKDYVEVLYRNLIDRNADVAIGCFQYVFEGATEEQTEYKHGASGSTYIWSSEETLYHMLLQRKITTSAWGSLSRREFWNNVEFPKGKLYEDMGTSYKIYAQANKVVFIDQIIYYYLMRQGSIQNTSFNKKKMDELEMVTQCKSFIDKKYPSLREATTNRLISCCFHMLFSMNSYKEAPEESQKLMNIIKENRWNMLWGKKVNKKVRMACGSSYLGFDFTKNVYRLLGVQGRINM